MRPLGEMDERTRRNLRYVLTDIDDTLTDHSILGPEAYAALHALRNSGRTVVPITGRPSGWCDHIARMWPVRGVVGENGAFYFSYREQERRMVRRYHKDPEERREDARRLAELAERIPRLVPGCAVSVDQRWREADLAIDFCEDVAPLPMDAVLRIKGLFEEAGARAKISSIHVNGWFGDYDKLTMTRTFFREELGLDLDSVKDQVAFCGDSPNDAPMFAHFPHSVGVANVLDFKDNLPARPGWITQARGGAGFAELASALLRAD